MALKSYMGPHFPICQNCGLPGSDPKQSYTGRKRKLIEFACDQACASSYFSKLILFYYTETYVY